MVDLVVTITAVQVESRETQVGDLNSQVSIGKANQRGGDKNLPLVIALPVRSIPPNRWLNIRNG